MIILTYYESYHNYNKKYHDKMYSLYCTAVNNIYIMEWM